jgi:NADPH:quinone reductase-like Zn-dependent oxidoreductase
MSHVKIQSGIIMSGLGTARIEHDLAIPSPDPGQLLIKVQAIALNTPDWMALDYFGRPGAGMGFDFAGEVVEIGDRSEAWTIGDRVAGFVHACMLSALQLPACVNEISILGHAANYANGSFREYVLADEDLLIRLPEHLSFAEASTLGMGVSTAAQALYQWLPLPLPVCDATPSNQTVLIYGGSTATGSIAIQLAKL